MTSYRLSVCSGGYGPGDLSAIVDRVARAGYDGIELTVMYHLAPEETDAARLAAVRKLVRGAGLVVSALHFLLPPGLRFHVPEQAQRLDAHLRWVAEAAAALEADAIMVGGGGARSAPDGLDRAEAGRAIARALAPMAQVAGDAGIDVAFEALNRYETNVGTTLAEVLSYVDPLGIPSLTAGADVFHMNIEERHVGEALRAAAPRLGHVHLADSDRLAPGGGHVDFAGVLAGLDAGGYRGWLSMELFYITPQLAYLPDVEACDLQGRNAVEHIRGLLGSSTSKEQAHE